MSDSRPARRVMSPCDNVCAITDIGRVRSRNEDSVHVSSTGRLVVVADGMGGRPAGEVASALAVETVVAYVDHERGRNPTGMQSRIDDVIAGAVRATQSRVLEEGCREPHRRGLGATLIVGVIAEGRLHTCHVGDVRCYVRGASSFDRITTDHTEVGQLVRAGRLTSEEARTHPRRHYVLQAVGLPRGVNPEVNSRTLDAGAVVLFCSDGLWGAVRDDELRAILERDVTVHDRAAALVDRANQAGGRDNITVVVYEHPGPEIEPPAVSGP